MQIKHLNKKYFVIAILLAIILIATSYFFLVKKVSDKQKSADCQEEMGFAKEAATAWGNSQDIASKEYQSNFKKYLTDELTKSFEEEWSTLDNQSVKQFSKINIISATCDRKGTVTTIKMDIQKSDNYSNDLPAELTIEITKEKGRDLISGFAELYNNNEQKIY